MTTTRPTPLSELTQPATRQARCADCSTVIEQGGVQVGQHWLWSPVRCPPCIEKRNTALLESDAQDHEDETASRQLQEQRRIAKAVEALIVPPDYRDVSLRKFEFHSEPADREFQRHVVRKGIQYIGTWPEPPQTILVLRGGVGTGKGHWAWSVTKAIVATTGARARVVKCSDLVRRLRASWGQAQTDVESESAALSFYRELDLLVIDEVSTHAFYGQQIHQHLYDVIDHRTEWRRPTILTSNESDAGLEAILRPALMDRLHHRGGILEFGEASYRKLPKQPTTEGAA